MIADEKSRFVADVATRYGRRVRAFIASRLRNAADVSDLAQEVFLRLLRADRTEQIRNPEAYLLTIASHVVAQHTMSAEALTESLDSLGEYDSALSIESDPAAQVHLQRRLEALDRALNRIPTKARAAFVLQRRDGCTLDEIASQLGISRAMVKKYLAIALVRCSRQIEDQG